MSQHEYGYGPPDGYYPPHPNSNQAFTSGLAPTNGSNASQPYIPSNAHQSPAEYHHNVIPGLGLSPSNNSATWLSQSPHAARQPPAHSQHMSDLLDRGGKVVATFVPATSHSGHLPGVDAGNVEEGELSEGGLEDIYEPPESGFQEMGSTIAQMSKTSGASATHTQDATVLDRSGSYSPHLSPVDVRPADLGGTQQQGTHPDQPAVNQRPSSAGATIDGTLCAETIVHHPTEMSVEQARKQAQDAIVRLWPLNVRFHDYVREGIDQRLLQTLFQDLGLATNEPSPPKPQSQPAFAVSTTKESAERVHKDDQAEERKDRIARLLAAKGSKPTIASQSNTPARTQSPPPITTTARPQSEKSRLLQQKMEALQRAREAKAQQSAQTSEPTTDRSDTPQVDLPVETVDRPQTAEAPDGLEQRNSRSTPSIPGLFLSSTPQPGPSPRPQKRPVASDLINTSEIPAKRPFGQQRQSQPFLIDVSDDDDDDEAAMEIDSPESRPVTINKPSSPFKIPHLADLTGSLVQIPNRHVSSPGAILTPGVANPAIKKHDLANMDKEIEAMKRKIAEAEARKRVKLSRPSSPSTPLSGEQNDRDSVSSKVASVRLMASTEEPDITGENSTPLILSETRHEESARRSETTLPKRRSVSRAASERLPLIEAHRKQQLLKLQMLQSQIRKVEDEIQKSLAEEKALMEEEGSQSGHNSAQGDLSTKQGSSNIEHLQDTDNTAPREAPLIPCAAQLEDSPQRDLTVSQEPAASAEESTNDDSDESASSRVAEEQANIEADASYNPLSSQVKHAATAKDDMDLDIEGVGKPDNEDSDAYEPADAESESSTQESSDASFSPAPVAEQTAVQASDADVHIVSAITPITQPISLGKQGSGSESPREAVAAIITPPSTASRSGFVPYETPLQYFRAYRFHPQFNKSVAGGLRSLTYSNKIDVKKEFCPDQLAGNDCARGSQCQFQHFESIQAPDDQILVQLGGYSDYEGERKQDYVNGLRQLLTDFRTRKVKDFQTISQGIIDYRSQFRSDKTKILPLGDVSL